MARRLDSSAARWFDGDADLISRAKATPTLRVTALLGIFLATQSAASAQDAIELNGESLPLNCAEWKRNQDGSWTSVGTLMIGNKN